MKVVYFHNRIKDFIDRLDRPSFKHFFGALHKLETTGHNLRMPDSKSLGNGSFELRIPSDPQIRAIFGFNEDKAVIVHIFFKKTMAIPKHELDYAYGVWKSLIA
jgi:phage-related protein